MKNLKYISFLICLITFYGCKESGVTDNNQQTMPLRTPDWVEGALTQPVPSWGSSTRLILPVMVDQIVFGPGGGIGSFGAHLGGHPEGLDHVWIEVIAGIPIKSWGSGTVTKIENMSGEYFITIDYDGGLVGKHMEVQTPLISLGQHVNAGDPVCYGISNGITQSAEFMLIDKNRNDGEVTQSANPTGSYVSPFDYLRDDLRQSLETAFSQKVITPYFSQGLDAGNNNRYEPYLTNRMIFHKLHKGTIAGDWLLDSKWGTGNYMDIMTLLDVDNEYIKGKKITASNDFYNGNNSIEGTWSADTTNHRFIFYSWNKTYFGIYQLDESGPRAKLKIEYSTNSYPVEFSSSAAVYIERAPLPRRIDAEELGVY